MSQPRRALPARYVDLITYGTPRSTIRRQGRDVAIHNTMYRTALAALNAEWTFDQWHAEVSRRGSVLAAQIATDRRARDRPRAQVEKHLGRVWDAAAAQVEQSPRFTQEDRRAYVATVRDWLADPGCPAEDNVRKLVDAVARRCADLGVTATACSRAYLLEATGLGLTALRTAQRRAEETGLLFVVQRGRRGTKASPSTGIATVFRLPRAEMLPDLRGAPSAELLTYAADAASSAPERCPPRASSAPPPAPKPQVTTAISAAAPAPTHTPQENKMITVTVSGDDADALAERLAELLAGTSVKIGPPTQLAVIAGGRAEGDEGRPPGRRRRQQSRDLAEAVAVPGQLPMPGTDR